MFGLSPQQTGGLCILVGSLLALGIAEGAHFFSKGERTRRRQRRETDESLQEIGEERKRYTWMSSKLL